MPGTFTSIVRCRERELCWFVHGDDFIVTRQLAWKESRLNEGLILERRAILGPNAGDNKTVAILNRLVTWLDLSASRNKLEIAADPRHREILLAQMNQDSTNVKSETTPAMKMQEWTPQMLTKIDKDREKCSDACGERGGTFHGRAERGSMDHAQSVWFDPLWVTAGSCK